jgi:hypothetical protein
MGYKILCGTENRAKKNYRFRRSSFKEYFELFLLLVFLYHVCIEINIDKQHLRLQYCYHFGCR